MVLLPTRISSRMTYGILILLTLTALVLYAVMAFVGKPLLIKSGIQGAEQSAAAIAEGLNVQLERIQGTATAIARMAGSIPHDEQLIKTIVPPMIDQHGNTSIPGGGFGWAPNAFAPGVERKLLFWSRDASGKLVYHDDYNKDDAPRYFEQPWFLAAKAATPGRCRWAEAFREPVSGVAMTACHVPFRVNGSFAGVIGVDFRLDGLAQLLQRKNTADGYAFAVDQAGNLMYFPGLHDDGKNLPTITQLAQQQAWFDPIAKALNASVPKRTTILVDTAGAVQQAAYVTLEPMPDSGWWVGVVTPEKQVTDLAQKLITRMLVILLPFLALLLAGAWLVGKGLLAQLEETTEQIKRLGHDGAGTDQLQILRSDELGDLRHAVNQYVASLKEMLGGIASEAATLENQAGAMADLSNGLAQRVDSQREDNGLLATAIVQMSASADEVARNTNQCSDTSDSALSMARNSQSEVQACNQAIETLANDIVVAAQSITQLGLDIDKIGTVLDVIKSISQQTNLLALNAAIEAARAGEQGRGFAVVADEVRTLAGRTQVSADEIQTMITALRQASHQAVAMMQTGSSRTQSVVQNVSEMTNTLGFTVKSFEDIAQRAQQIAVAAQQQSSVTHEINELAVRIHGASEQNAEDVTALRSMGNNLHQVSSRLAKVSHD